MSHRASVYVLDVLERDRELPQGARAVLLALAVRANLKSGATYTGDWLARAAGMNHANVRRNIARLVAAGYISVRHREGRASVVGFPVLGFVADVAEITPPAGRRDNQGQFHPAFCGCPECQEMAG